jgi:S1-C subfamily serine protease
VREINPYLFGLKIKSLTSFIDQLGLMTFFEKNVPIGCLVTGVTTDSLGLAFGLENNDVLISLNDISLHSVDSRIAAYEFVMQKKDLPGFLFTLTLLRHNMIEKINFLVQSNIDTSMKHAGILNLKKINKL